MHGRGEVFVVSVLMANGLQMQMLSLHDKCISKYCVKLGMKVGLTVW